MWRNGGPGSAIPAHVKRAVKARDKVCQLGYPDICNPAGPWQYDHHPPLYELGIARDDPAANDPARLRLVCAPCHARQSGIDARALQLTRGRHRAPTPHPGLTGAS
jgi:hypothetical protein